MITQLYSHLGLVLLPKCLPLPLALLAPVLGESLPSVQLLLRGGPAPHGLLQGSVAELKLLLGADQLTPALSQATNDLGRRTTTKI